ncbi:hypothetical protein B0E53_05552 [Micromonospora sp. MH33]|nr:hypothetical protein B0E53_05552 [Micromonospora sp. MH33]
MVARRSRANPSRPGPTRPVPALPVSAADAPKLRRRDRRRQPLTRQRQALLRPPRRRVCAPPRRATPAVGPDLARRRRHCPRPRLRRDRPHPYVRRPYGNRTPTVPDADIRIGYARCRTLAREVPSRLGTLAARRRPGRGAVRKRSAPGVRDRPAGATVSGPTPRRMLAFIRAGGTARGEVSWNRRDDLRARSRELRRFVTRIAVGGPFQNNFRRRARLFALRFRAPTPHIPSLMTSYCKRLPDRPNRASAGEVRQADRAVPKSSGRGRVTPFERAFHHLGDTRSEKVGAGVGTEPMPGQAPTRPDLRAGASGGRRPFPCITGNSEKRHQPSTTTPHGYVPNRPDDFPLSPPSGRWAPRAANLSHVCLSFTSPGLPPNCWTAILHCMNRDR